VLIEFFQHLQMFCFAIAHPSRLFFLSAGSDERHFNVKKAGRLLSGLL